ncbi:hypothetical protein [Enterococcus gallinarum]|uniref:hypothetical protein n=1 Tax=Enterococcus gallinarum TaxID=1353 RepID=UPI0022E4C392|nr:hypothetical protein [Enterococcus gallinarum]
MKAKKFNVGGGYTPDRASQYNETSLPSQLLTEEAYPMKKFIDGKPTDEVEWYRYWFIQAGNEPFEVKMKVPLTNPVFLNSYIFENLEATLFDNNVFFRADSAKEVK